MAKGTKNHENQQNGWTMHKTHTAFESLQFFSNLQKLKRIESTTVRYYLLELCYTTQNAHKSTLYRLQTKECTLSAEFRSEFLCV